MKSGYKDSLDQYTNLVNQPTWADNVGDAYTQAGSQPAQGASQRSTNALLLGVGAGLKGGAAQDRQQQLSPMLQKAGQITAKAAELEAQAQQEQSRQFAVQEFGQKYTPLVATFADLVNNNDPRSVIVFKDLISKAGSIPGYENLEAESWDASKGYGLALNTQTGEYRKITADEIISAIAPSAQAIYGDKWFEKFLPLNAGVAKDAEYVFNTNRQATELGLNEKRAGIANQYSQANQHNASAESTRQEMNNPVDDNAQKLDLEIKKDRAVKNYTAVEKEMLPRLNANENVLGVYEAIEDIRKNNPSIVGSDYYTQAKRALATNLGLSADIDYANLKSVEFEKMLKPILGAQLGEKEGERVLSKFISLKQNPAAIDKFLLEEKPRIIKDIVRDKQKIAHYDKENHANLYSENIHSNIDQEVQNYSKTRGKTVTMIAPDGSTREVPKEQAKLWESRGARLTE